MIDAAKIAAEAAAGFGLSLRDDPTAWDEALDAVGALRLDQLPASSIVEVCEGAAAMCAASALRQQLGRVAEALAQAADVAYAEDGVLADVDAVVAAHVSGLRVDMPPARGKAQWDDYVAAVRAALAQAADASPPPLPPSLPDVLAYMNSDARFDGMGTLKKSVAALSRPAPVDPDGSFTPPDFVARAFAAPAVAVEPADPVEPEAAPPRKARRPAKAASAGDQGMPARLHAAGFTRADAARILGFSESYMGYCFAGKKPWPALDEEQAARVRAALEERAAAVELALDALSPASA